MRNRLSHTCCIASSGGRGGHVHVGRRTQAHRRNQYSTRIDAVDSSVTQDVIIGGAVAVSVGATLYFALSKEPEVCPSCAGSGGVVCFACQGSGIMDGKVPDEIEAAARRESLGRNRSRNECRACKGVGRLLCKKCGGTGYR